MVWHFNKIELKFQLDIMNERRDYVDQGTRCSKNTVSKNVSRILAKNSVLVNEPKPSSKKINLSSREIIRWT